MSTTQNPRSRLAAKVTQQDADYLRSLDDSEFELFIRKLKEQDLRLSCEVRDATGRPTRYLPTEGFTERALAEWFGVQQTAVKKWREAGMPCLTEGARHIGLGGKNYYDVQQVARWLAEVRARKEPTGDRAAIENAQREETLRMQEIRRKKLEGTLVDVQPYQERIQLACATIRQAVEGLHRVYGDELVDQLSSTMEEVQRILGV